MNPVKMIEKAIKAYDGVLWTASGYPLSAGAGSPPKDLGWVKFGIVKSEIGWRTLEFLAWVFTDMERAGERLRFFPTAPAPYLNVPGKCLSFVVECYPRRGDALTRFRKVARFLDWI
jgi:hypothetical protein